jgi:hypothetical protein
VGLVLIVAFGRIYVSEHMPENVWARAITGLRSGLTPDDPTAGRVGLLKMTLDKTESTFMGIGIQEVGSEGIEGSATPPVYWLLLTGVPGLLLLLGRETALIVSARSLVRRTPAMLPVAQALVAVMAQQISYGTWMNPNYMVPAAMVLVSAQRALGRRHKPAFELVSSHLEPLQG